jgi:hypothetical protein
MIVLLSICIAILFLLAILLVGIIGAWLIEQFFDVSR